MIARTQQRLHDARLQRRRQQGDRRAAAELAERYLPLARALARRYHSRGEPFDDLVQVASVGLLLAINRWDPSRGTTFSTFAVPTIVGELRRHFRDRGWAVRPPRAKQELSLTVARVQDELSQDGGRTPTAAEIATALGCSESVVREGLEVAAARRADSLDAPVGGADEPLAAIDVLGEPDRGYAHVEDVMTLDRLSDGLDTRARQIMRLRFRDDLVQREIAARVGLSQMHVSRILRDSLAQMQAEAA